MNKKLSIEALRKGAAEKEAELARVKPLLAPAIAEREKLQIAMTEAAANGKQGDFAALNKQCHEQQTYIDYLSERVNFLEASKVPGVTDADIIAYWNEERLADCQAKLEAAEKKLMKARKALRDEFVSYANTLLALEGERRELNNYTNDKSTSIGRMLRLKHVAAKDFDLIRGENYIADKELQELVNRTAFI